MQWRFFCASCALLGYILYAVGVHLAVIAVAAVATLIWNIVTHVARTHGQRSGPYTDAVKPVP